MKLEQGARLPEFRIGSVSAERMKAMAVLLQDPNPIHLDPSTVLEAGLGDRVINQGPTNLGYAINVALNAFPSARLTSIEARYVGIVFAGDTVVAGGTIAAVSAEADGTRHRVDLEIWADVEGGGRAIEATATLHLARD